MKLMFDVLQCLSQLRLLLRPTAMATDANNETSLSANDEKLQELDRSLFKCLSLRAESVNSFL